MKIIQVIEKCGVSTSLSNIWRTNLSKTRYSDVLPKSESIMDTYKKSFLKTSYPHPSTFFCKVSKFFQIAVLRKSYTQLIYTHMEKWNSTFVKTCKNKAIKKNVYHLWHLFLWQKPCLFQVVCLVEVNSKFMQEKTRLMKFLLYLVFPILVH